ncbi:GNAT family N-acetyltransferase [Nocardiopsis lambiniae]|uniref:GNAT family N-acetyltransferase n=1 Tax=Nocardiopsis lambiniae TaxID=3075539 RepID=A0ABU2M349_9ACTN|nr:GNAT family N-acetyltransferase [Nocardiopsis sp. DSM 44743]MDT0327076.1 GNAT family N-acetyltransferase [Nocardiopsis sp. DSM 44743]
MDLTVVDVPDRSRYEVSVDGKVVGFSAYHRLEEGVLALPHVEVDPAHQGRGVAAELMRRSLEDVRTKGLKVMPICPYARAYIAKHTEYADLVQ